MFFKRQRKKGEKNRLKIFLPLILTFLFFLISFLTLKDYGISWDETLHFRRGQAYLRYFLTGKTNYQDLAEVNLQGTNGDPDLVPLPRRSFYQNETHNADYWLANDSGHPPLNDDLAASFNYLFFQKLGILGDVQSFHLFNILVSSFLVWVVVSFACQTFGCFSGIVSFLALVTYPLFFAESHFNIKDPVLAAFYAGTIWFFYRSLKTKKPWDLILACLCFGLALGTKFNILFLPFILAPYLLLRYWKEIKQPKKLLTSFPRNYWLSLGIGLVLASGLFFLSWPFLWFHFPNGILKILGYYQSMGTGVRYQPDSFYLLGFNTFPLQWIILTTPPWTLLLALLGIVFVFSGKDKAKEKPASLWLIWLIVPILRVSLPGTTIYGGIRQIFEYLPALALLSGFGGHKLLEKIGSFFNKHRFSGKEILLKIIPLGLILAFIWPILVLIKLHPYQNVYFNFLIGGLSGAQKVNFPSWGNTFGCVYKQGIEWLNENAELGAKATLFQGTLADAPLIWVRKDIDYQKTNWSGIDREGEYLMELTFNDTGQSFYYAWEYVDTFLEPVYELKVEGVSILKIWKNDLAHTKPEYRLREVRYSQPLRIEKENNFLTVDLKQDILLSQIKLGFTPQPGCSPLTNSFVETSLDQKTWFREKDWIPFPQVRNTSNLENNLITFFLAARKARYLRFVLDNIDSCALNNPELTVFQLKS